MRLLRVKRLFIMPAIMALFVAPVFSQEEKLPQPASMTERERSAAPQADEAPSVPASAPTSATAELSIYGEVQAVNIAMNYMTVQYYDYDSDEEKTIDITMAKDTKVENAAGLSGIKQNDWADVSYVVKDGKNVATMVSVEREEAQGAEKMPEEVPIEPVEE